MRLDQQHATGLSQRRIEDALLAPAGPQRAAAVGISHPWRISTPWVESRPSNSSRLAEIERSDEVLDAGSGVGGTARYLADQFGCRVTAVDLTEEYCNTSRWLNRLIGLDGYISVHQADVTNLPFASASFTLVISQHVQMNGPTRPASATRPVVCCDQGGSPSGTSPPAPRASSTSPFRGLISQR